MHGHTAPPLLAARKLLIAAAFALMTFTSIGVPRDAHAEVAHDPVSSGAEMLSTVSVGQAVDIVAGAFAVTAGAVEASTELPSVPTVESDQDALSVFQRLVELGQAGETVAAIGAGLMLAIYAVRKFKVLPSVIPGKYIGTATLFLTALTGFGGALFSGYDPWAAALAFLIIGGFTIGLWEGVFKHLVEAVGMKPATSTS